MFVAKTDRDKKTWNVFFSNLWQILIHHEKIEKERERKNTTTTNAMILFLFLSRFQIAAERFQRARKLAKRIRTDQRGESIFKLRDYVGRRANT